MTAVTSGGPLTGLRVVEFAGIGPAPHCAMLLSDMGAEVLRIERPGGNGTDNAVVDRGRALLHLDIRNDAGRERCLTVLDRADVLIEGFRPGVMERLGLGPAIVTARNQRIIYGRMTGWGQTGPLAHSAGHDINYIALSGALAAIGEVDGSSVPPLNLVGDYGGGSMFLAFGVLAALWERERSGEGQVVDAAIVDGVASLMNLFSGMVPTGRLSLERSQSLLGGAAPYYRCYTCADGLEIAIGAIEPQFYAEFLNRIGAPAELRERQEDTALWPERTAELADIFLTRTREEWSAILEGTDACYAPVLTLAQAPSHSHAGDRNTYVEIDGISHPAPAPRFSRTPGAIQAQSSAEEMLARWGVGRED